MIKKHKDMGPLQQHHHHVCVQVHTSPVLIKDSQKSSFMFGFAKNAVTPPPGSL